MTSLRVRASDEFSRRRRQAKTLMVEHGPREFAAYTLSALARKLERPKTLDSIDDEAILAADIRNPTHPSPQLMLSPPYELNWVMSPPSLGSGGHGTTFRLIRYLQRHGHRCRIYLYDAFRADFLHYQRIIREHFADSTTEVEDVRSGMRDADAVFATSWETAYVVYNSPCGGRRFYLVQDLEHLFYAAGSASILAENTYRMGFHGVTAGRWLASTLSEHYDMTADSFDFGCDTSTYHLRNEDRNGVAFYAKPGVGRRAFELGVLALELLSVQHPDVKIHLFGDEIGRLRFPFIDHGVVTPTELNSIYNSCFAGLSLSMTNVSLVPYEMLAAGCIPVVNDAIHNRVVLNNSHVVYAESDPHSLAAALETLLRNPNDRRRAEAASESVQAIPWTAAGEAVERVLLRELSGESSEDG